jgi:hypothetical protein
MEDNKIDPTINKYLTIQKEAYKMFLPNCEQTKEEYMEFYKHDPDSPDNKHNEKCNVDSKCCSSHMSLYKGVCAWHYVRMARWYKAECGCNRRWIYCDSDGTGRHIFRKYYDTFEMPVSDGQLYCCGFAQNSDEIALTCGNMRVCAGHASLHNGDGPVKVLTKNISGTLQGKGFKVYCDEVSKNIITYDDAIKAHLYYKKRCDDLSFDWLVIASHMEDRPSYVTSMIVDGLVYQ